MSKKAALVTGGAGFLGSNLCKYLLDLNYKVICLDNLYTGSKNNIAPFFLNPNFTFIEHDVCNKIDIADDIHEIYNLACAASPVHYQADAIGTTKTSVFGAIHMLELAMLKNAKILQSSTSEVYGDAKVHPQPETYWGNVNPIGIRSCYDEGKRCAESLFMDYHRKYGVEIKIVRIFNTYGPNMNPQDGRVVSNFIVQALQNQDITIYGDGKQTRSFCYVQDLIDAIYAMMQTPKDIIGPINTGNPVEFNMLELAQKVIQKTNSKSKLVYKDLPKDDPCVRRPDISLAQKYLNWTPKVNLEEGLDLSIPYFKQKLSL